MARLATCGWRSNDVAMRVRGALALPESGALHLPEKPLFSPAEIESRAPPRECSVHELPVLCSPCPPSSRLLLHGGPGFSLAVLDAFSSDHAENVVQRVAVPLPQERGTGARDFADFSSAEILSTAMVGEGQLWAGTEIGSLHVFDLEPDLSLSGHQCTSLADPILCISSGHCCGAGQLEVLLGCASGRLLAIRGRNDDRGSMRSPFKCLRKVVQLSCLEAGSSVCTIARAGDNYWCGCGHSISVVSADSLKELESLEALPGGVSESVEVTQLQAEESGVWSALSHCPAVTLWDTTTLKPKMTIASCNPCPHVRERMGPASDVCCFAFLCPFLFMGTEGGHLLVFRVLDGRPPGRQYSPAPAALTPPPDYKLVTGMHCHSDAIISISPTRHRTGYRHSPLESPPGTPCPAAGLILTLVCRHGPDTGPASCSVRQLELVTSPPQSPLVSPTTGQLSPVRGASALGSLSLQGMTSLPNLVLSEAAERSLLLIPLSDS